MKVLARLALLLLLLGSSADAACMCTLTGRNFVAAVYTFGTITNVGGPNCNDSTGAGCQNVHDWLGTQLDYVSDWEGVFGFGSCFGWSNGCNALANYPSVGMIFASAAGQSAATVADYNSCSAGSNDTSYNNTLGSLGAGPVPVPNFLYFDTDREWNFDVNLQTGGVRLNTALATAWAACINHMADVIHTKFPGYPVCVAWSVAPNQTGFGDYTTFMNALNYTKVNCIGADFYPGSQNQGSDQADWTAFYGDASPNTVPSLSMADGTLGWGIAYANSKGIKFVVPEWGTKDTLASSNLLVFKNSATVFRNNSAIVVAFNYWGLNFLGNTEHLVGGKAQEFINQFGMALAQPYTGTFFKNWAQPTATQAVTIHGSPSNVPY